jgi:Predicted metal-binding protein
MYKISHHTAEIALDEYIQDYRDADKFIGYCKECRRYNACWACPPFDFSTDEYLSAYKTASIIGTKVLLSKDLRDDNTGEEVCTRIAYDIMEKARLDLDRQLLEMESRYPHSRAFFAGTCHVCRAEDCTRRQGKPCIAPEKVRPSLESFGFDISKTCSELLGIEMLWSKNGVLPEYFILVSGIMK